MSPKKSTYNKMADTDAVQQSNPLSRKLNKILERRLDNDKDIVEALRALSLFFNDNSLRSRRNLRGDIEKRSLLISEQFESAFTVVKEQLDAVHAEITEMNDCCQEMTSRLKGARDQTSDLISSTTKLQAESQRIQMQEKVAQAFLSKFQLHAEEAKSLRGSRNVPITEDFFTALARVKEIHNDCKVLLRTKQQTAGLETMETMAMHLEAGYEKLYRWTQDECRSLTGDLPEISSTLSRAMQSMKDRPVLFKYCLDEYGTARRTAVVRCFVDALTRGGPSGTPRPIELHSHDPIRLAFGLNQSTAELIKCQAILCTKLSASNTIYLYQALQAELFVDSKYVGDMLAWLHQAIASEKELLNLLLEKSSGSRLTSHHKPAEEEPDGKAVLCHITEGVCRPFKVRVEQVIVSEPGAVTLFSLNNILKFYGITISGILGEEAAVITTIQEMTELATKMFFNSISCHAGKLLEKVELPPPDLGPTETLKETLKLLQDVLTSHDASVIPLDARQTDYSRIISCLVDPALQMSVMSASHLNSADMAAYMINCIHQIHSALAVYEFTDKHLEMLAAQMDAHVDTLISEQASFILSRSGLGNVYTVFQESKNQKVPLSTVHGLDPQTIKAAMAKFDNYLSSPDTLRLPQCELLRTTRLRDSIYKRAVDAVCDAYRTLYTMITEPRNNYNDPTTIVPRTVEQVANLLT